MLCGPKLYFQARHIMEILSVVLSCPWEEYQQILTSVAWEDDSVGCEQVWRSEFRSPDAMLSWMQQCTSVRPAPLQWDRRQKCQLLALHASQQTTGHPASNRVEGRDWNLRLASDPLLTHTSIHTVILLLIYFNLRHTTQCVWPKWKPTSLHHFRSSLTCWLNHQT